ncbi:MAG: AMP-binding protein [Mesorhizobium sp.]|nr:AMP-binding protein [Mesorhizobium sp.]
MALPAFPIHDIVDRAAEKWGEKSAIEFRGRTISYAVLRDQIAAAAERFAERGVKSGDRVALLLPNTPWHPIAFFGALKAGAVVVHLSPLDAPRVLRHKIADSGASLLVTTNFDGLATLAAGLVADGTVGGMLVGDDALWSDSVDTGALPQGSGIQPFDLRSAPRAAASAHIPDLDDLALLQYTGGTTGMPKAAQLTHRNLSSAVSSYDLWYTGNGLSRPGEDRVLLFLPLFHIYGLTTVLLRGLRNGHTILLRSRFDPLAALDDIEAGATSLPGVPTMWIALAQTPGFETRDLSSLRLAASGGAPMPVEVARRVAAKTGLEVLGGWGMSETAPAGTNRPAGYPDKAASIGIPLPGVDLRIVALDDPCRALPTGKTGELAVRGPNVTTGYHNRPDENAACFADGWFLTGDIGHMDQDGFFFIVDRKKDMIISGGFNVYPQMIEQAIYEHADVEEVLVIGIPDAYRGESAKAFVKLRAGAAPLTLDGLRAFLEGRVGRHEMPVALEIRAALPRTPVGKLSKFELKQDERARSAAVASQGA